MSMLQAIWSWIVFITPWVMLTALVIIAVTSPAWLPVLLVKLGDIDEGWNFIRVQPPEGEMFALASGTENGPFAKLLESVPGYIYEEDKHEFRVLLPGEVKPKNGFLGVTVVGFNKKVIQRETHYQKLELLPSGKWGLKKKDRKGPSIFFQYNMATEITQAETSDNFPVSAVVNFTIQMFSPVKALFMAGGWEAQVNAAVQGLLREYISTRDINELRLEQNQKSGSGIAEKLTKEHSEPGGEFNQSLLQFGVRIVKATFVDFNLVEGDPEIAKATKAAGVAKLMRGAAEDKAAAISAEYEARIKSGGAHAGTFRMAEAIEVAKPKAIGAGMLVSE